MNVDTLHRQQMLSAVEPFTMVGPERLEALYAVAETLEAQGIEGDIVHCGVCNGGSAAVAAHCVQPGSNRTVWLFDSFQGLPEPTDLDGSNAPAMVGQCKGNVASVQLVFSMLGIDMSSVNIIPGWIEQTLHTVSLDRIALLSIDVDWYEPIKLCLEKFYDSVHENGFIYIDDYGHWPGAKLATEEFFAARHLSVPKKMIDYTGCMIHKSDVRPT